MGRAYLILVLFAGAFVSVLNAGPPPSSDALPKGSSDRLAKLGASSGGPASGASGGSVADAAIELTRSPDGHFYADVEINGATVHALVDTGASAIALSREDARSAGLAVSVGMPGVVGEGADGEVYGEYVTLDRVALGHRSAEGLSAVVLNSGEQTLLGQNFLSEFESVEIQGDRMVLR